jgi:Tfp pilus assembly protein PilN
VSQVNLLPPELVARQKTRKLTSLIVLGGAVAVALLLAFWFLQSQQLSGVNDDIAAQDATNAKIQAQISDLSQYQQLQSEAATKQQLLGEAYTGEVSYSQMLLDISRVIPSNAYLTTFSSSLTAVSTTTPGTTTAVGAPTFAGSFSAGGEGQGLDSLASWLTRIESVKGWVNPWLSSAAETTTRSGFYTFTSGVDLSSDAVTPRGQEASGGG